jgi:hypothetical protein
MFDCGALRPSCRRFLNLVLRHGQDLSENCLSVDHGHSAPRMEADAKRPISARSRRAGLAEDPVRRLRPPSTPLGGRTNSLDPVRRSRRTTSRQVLSGDGDFTRGSLAGFFCRNFCKAPRVLAFGKRLGKMSAAYRIESRRGPLYGRATPAQPAPMPGGARALDAEREAQRAHAWAGPWIAATSVCTAWTCRRTCCGVRLPAGSSTVKAAELGRWWFCQLDAVPCSQWRW